MANKLYELVLERQGWDKEFLEKINSPITQTLQHMDTMISTLKNLKDTQKPIVVLPDFDMDGISSGILLYAGLSELGFNVSIIIPDYNRGHDLDKAYVSDIKKAIPSVGAIITTDSGVNSVHIAKKAKEEDILFLVTDHHGQDVENEYASVIVNPNQYGEDYPFEGICGAMVVYLILEAYTQKYDPNKLEDIKMLRVFAGIGTVADVMPILYSNRQMVSDSVNIAKLLYGEYGVSPLLEHIVSGNHTPAYTNAFLGLAQIIDTFKQEGKLRSIDDINESFYGFYLAPSFNAARRIEADIAPAFNVFTTSNADERESFAKYIFDLNETRKEMVETFLDETEQINNIVYRSDAPPGVLGLLANKISKISDRPTMMLQNHEDGSWSGSARSPMWFPLKNHINELGAVALGHEYACGIQFENKEQLANVCHKLDEIIEETFQKLLQEGDFESNDVHLGYGDTYDWDLQDEENIFETIKLISLLSPFGHGFREPTFDITINLKECSLRKIGKEQNHISITTKTGIKLLWWNSLDYWADLIEIKESPIPSEGEMTFKVKLQINEFRDTVSINGIIETMI